MTDALQTFTLGDLKRGAGDDVDALVLALVRTGTLHCYAGLLSEAAAQLGQRRSSRNALAAHTLVRAAANILTYLIDRSFVDEACRELRDSRLLEHWARALLLLAGCEGQENDVAEELLWAMSAKLLVLPPPDSSVANCHASPCLSYLLSSHMVQLCAALDGGTTYGLPDAEGAATATAAPALVFGPIDLRLLRLNVADTMLAQWGLAAWMTTIRQARGELRAALQRDPRLADAPGVRGLPGVPRAGPLPEPRQGPGAAAAGHAAPEPPNERTQTPPTGLPAAGASSPSPPLPAEVEHWVRCASVPPLNTRAAFEVAMRLAAAAVDVLPPPPPQDERAAVACGGVGADAGSSTAAAPHSGGAHNPQRWAMNVRQAPALAVRALRCAREACMDEAAAAAGAVTEAVRRRLHRFWSLLLTVTERAQLMEAEEARPRDVGERWSFTDLNCMMSAMVASESAAEELPSAPAPDVAAALSAGYVRRMERMMRVVEFKYASRMIGPCASDYAPQTAGTWGQVLAFGPLRETLALLATAAKRMRRIEKPRSNPGKAHIIYIFEIRGVDLAYHTRLLEWLRRLLPEPQPGARAAAALAAAAGGGEHARYPPGGPQLRVMLSFIALHLLPPLFRKLPEVVAEIAAHYFNEYDLTAVLLRWVPLLAAARARTSWGSSLLAGPEWDLAGLLGAALGQELLGGLDGVRPALVGALRALLHLAPELLAEALPGAEDLAAAIEAENADLAAELQEARRAPVLGGGAGGSGNLPGAMPALRRVFGPDSESPEPELLAALERLSARSGGADGSEAATAAEAYAAGPGGSAAGLPAELRSWVAAASLLVPPAELLPLLPGCANPRCTNLSGPSELALPLPVRCGGCGGRASYCSEGCREQHRAEGHGAECAGAV